jgi:hypothetical protein
VNFSNLPATTNKQFTAFPTDFTKLPTVSYVIPNLCNNMHDCSVATGDTWLKNKLKSYADWATTHNSVLIVDFDEDDFTTTNRVPTVFTGQLRQDRDLPGTDHPLQRPAHHRRHVRACLSRRRRHRDQHRRRLDLTTCSGRDEGARTGHERPKGPLITLTAAG